MPDWSPIYQDAAKRKAAAKGRAEVRRALNPETGEPVPYLTIPQKLKLKAMSKFFTIIVPWVMRRLSPALSSLGIMLKVDPNVTEQTKVFLTALLVFLIELVQKWVILWWQGFRAKRAASTPPVLGLLLMLATVAALSLSMTACKTPLQRAAEQFERLTAPDPDAPVIAE